MRRTRALRRGGSLGRRLFLMFLLVAILPLAVSDWVSTTAVTEVAERLDRDHRGRTTRQVSRQVYDRLMAGHSLLATLPAAGLRSVQAGAVPGLGTVFRSVSLLGADGRALWSSAGDRSPDALAAAAAAVAIQPHRASDGPAAPVVDIELRVTHPPAAAARLWLAQRLLGPADQARWVAELNPDHIWAPLTETDEDSAWRVFDAAGRSLITRRGGDYPADWTGPGELQPGAAPVDTSNRLFLENSFGSADWRFSQRTPPPSIDWQGHPLVGWLALVAMATLLGIAVLTRWQIRRTLQPLQQLTDGTRRLAAGAAGTRVPVTSADDLGTLAVAFNDMAGRIEAQFDALTGLTAIDRDILDGAALPRLAERVLRRLHAQHPDGQARVSWLDPTGSVLHLAWLTPAPGTGATMQMADLTLDDGRRTGYEAITGDVLATPTAGEPAPWAAPPAAADTVQAWLPLQVLGRTRALIALSLPNGAQPGTLQPVRELRDRLAVALAARAREDELVHRAAHDSLTGLANRYGLHQHLDRMLSARGAELAVLFVDLDHFKDVNDSRGHAVGDLLLCEAGTRLATCVPPDAVVARQGGDEFAIVVPKLSTAEAECMAAGIIEALAKPYRLEERDHQLGASIGMALSPLHGQSREELLRRADVALYAAKAAGRGRAAMFSDSLDAQTQERVKLLDELRRAIAASEFVVHYQPRIQAVDGAIRSAEALVRWSHPQRGLLYPGAFIGLAESTGLIDAIGGLVLEQTCAQIALWRRDGLAVDRVSVNVSPHQLASGRLPGTVRELLERHRLPGSSLELEVTESVLVGDITAARDQLSVLRDWGVTIALDDFGTGYSSMATLRQLPIDVMKVDRSFVTDVCSDAGARAVIGAIVALAQSMRLQLVAEGIETEAQASLLGSLGCEELQGFLFSRAVPAAEFERLPGVGRVSRVIRDEPVPLGA